MPRRRVVFRHEPEPPRRPHDRPRPAESHRAATPLELLFDLTFVVAFSQISAQTAHYLELGDLSTALSGFAFTTFAVAWAWINYSWLASAYDNDDIFFRVATLIVMVGVLVVALGVPAVFHSIEEGGHLDNGVMVAGYVIMRVATVALWLRAAEHDPARRKTASPTPGTSRSPRSAGSL